MNKKTMIEAFQSVNKRRQSEEMPITALAMFSEAWDYKQAEIDALKTLGEMADKRIEYLVIRNTLLQARLDVAESNLKNSLGFIREEQSANDALQKRIDDALKELSNVSNRHVSNARNILKGDKND